MLGRLEMGLDECIGVYKSLFQAVFGKKKGLSVGIFSGKIQGRFDSIALEGCVKKVLNEKGLKENTLLNDGQERACRV